MHKKPNVVGQMTPEQTALLRKIAFDAYEPEAFSPNLTRAEAARRIDMLQAKLKLMSKPRCCARLLSTLMNPRPSART